MHKYIHTLIHTVSSIKEVDSLDKQGALTLTTMEIEKRLQWDQQVRAVENADVVIATHGGFESNLIFMRGSNNEYIHRTYNALHMYIHISLDAKCLVTLLITNICIHFVIM